MEFSRKRTRWKANERTSVRQLSFKRKTNLNTPGHWSIAGRAADEIDENSQRRIAWKNWTFREGCSIQNRRGCPRNLQTRKALLKKPNYRQNFFCWPLEDIQTFDYERPVLPLSIGLDTFSLKILFEEKQIETVSVAPQWHR